MKKDAEGKPKVTKTKLDLGALSDAELGKLLNARAALVQDAEEEYWVAECETMVREAKATFPGARYLGLTIDGSESGEFWSLEAVYDESGAMLADYDSTGATSEQFEEFENRFAGDYRVGYTSWFGIDDRPYFDLEVREPLTEIEYNKSLAGPAV
jgi:hypothetical protein